MMQFNKDREYTTGSTSMDAPAIHENVSLQDAVVGDHQGKATLQLIFVNETGEELKKIYFEPTPTTWLSKEEVETISDYEIQHISEAFVDIDTLIAAVNGKSTWKEQFTAIATLLKSSDRKVKIKVVVNKRGFADLGEFYTFDVSEMRPARKNDIVIQGVSKKRILSIVPFIASMDSKTVLSITPSDIKKAAEYKAKREEEFRNADRGQTAGQPSYGTEDPAPPAGTMGKALGGMI